MNIKSTGRVLATGAMFALTETSEAAKNDPALAMRLAATSLTDTLLNKVNQPIKDSFQETVVPVVRGGILALNAVRCAQTIKDPLASGLDKAMDIGRVTSDLVGFLGGIAVLATPQFAEVGRTMMGFSYAVDAVSHAYRGLSHAGRRVAVWNHRLDEAKRRESEENQKAKCPEGPQEPKKPAEPSPVQPVSAERVKISIEGSASAAAAILRGEKPASLEYKFATA